LSLLGWQATDVKIYPATFETTVGTLRKHVLEEVTGGRAGFQIMLMKEARILSKDECKLADLEMTCDTGIIELNYVVHDLDEDATPAEVEMDPKSFHLHLAGHARAECNGVYTYAGMENGKHHWAKPAGTPKVFWTYW